MSKNRRRFLRGLPANKTSLLVFADWFFIVSDVGWKKRLLLLINFALVADSSRSILAVIAGALAPLFAPLGFGDWRVVTALIAGFMAKESVVSTLSVLFGSTASLLAAVSRPGAAALLVFCLLYTPCVAAIAAIKRELGGKWAAGVVVGQCAIAWVCALAKNRRKKAGNLMIDLLLGVPPYGSADMIAGCAAAALWAVAP